MTPRFCTSILFCVHYIILLCREMVLVVLHVRRIPRMRGRVSFFIL
jgi:hypothetical protein